MPDGELAVRVGRTGNAVRVKRSRLRIQPFGGYKRRWRAGPPT
jgi:hypothetical protein